MKIIDKIKDFSNKITQKNFSLSTLLPDLGLRNKPWNGGFLDAYKISLYVNAALRKRGQKVGETQFVIENKNGETVEDDPTLDLLNNPNPLMDGPMFWRTYQIIKDIYGSVYIWIESEKKELFSNVEEIKALHLIPPDKIRIEYRGTDVIFHWTMPDGKDKELKPEELLRRYNPDPGNVLAGLSILKAGSNVIHTDIQLAQHQANIIKNGGKIDGVFKFKTEGGLSKTQLEEIQEAYDKNYAKAKNSGKPLFLGGDAEYIRTALTPDELAYLESKKMSLNDIVIMTGVPKFLLASVDDIKFTNAEASLHMFLSETIVPEIKDLVNGLNDKLIKDSDKGKKISFIDPTPQNQEQMRLNLETASNVYALTTNEKRAELGYEPVEGGDEVLVPFSVKPLDLELEPTNNPKPNEDDDEE